MSPWACVNSEHLSPWPGGGGWISNLHSGEVTPGVMVEGNAGTGV